MQTEKCKFQQLTFYNNLNLHTYTDEKIKVVRVSQVLVEYNNLKEILQAIVVAGKAPKSKYAGKKVARENKIEWARSIFNILQ